MDGNGTENAGRANPGSRGSATTGAGSCIGVAREGARDHSNSREAGGVGAGPEAGRTGEGDDEDALELIGRLARKCTAVQRADIKETLPSLELPPPEDGKTETEEDPAASGTSELGSRWSE